MFHIFSQGSPIHWAPIAHNSNLLIYTPFVCFLPVSISRLHSLIVLSGITSQTKCLTPNCWVAGRVMPPPQSLHPNLRNLWINLVTRQQGMKFADGIEVANQLTSILEDYSGLNLITRVFKSGEGIRRDNQRDALWGGLGLFMLALKMEEGGHEPRDSGSL